VRHFVSEHVPKTTIYGVITRYEELGTATYIKKLKGGCLLAATKKLVKAVEKKFTNDRNISVRCAAAKLTVTYTILNRKNWASKRAHTNRSQLMSKTKQLGLRLHAAKSWTKLLLCVES